MAPEFLEICTNIRYFNSVMCTEKESLSVFKVSFLCSSRRELARSSEAEKLISVYLAALGCKPRI